MSLSLYGISCIGYNLYSLSLFQDAYSWGGDRPLLASASEQIA